MSATATYFETDLEMYHYLAEKLVTAEIHRLSKYVALLRQAKKQRQTLYSVDTDQLPESYYVEAFGTLAKSVRNHTRAYTKGARVLILGIQENNKIGIVALTGPNHSAPASLKDAVVIEVGKGMLEHCYTLRPKAPKKKTSRINRSTNV